METLLNFIAHALHVVPSWLRLPVSFYEHRLVSWIMGWARDRMRMVQYRNRANQGVVTVGKELDQASGFGAVTPNKNSDSPLK